MSIVCDNTHQEQLKMIESNKTLCFINKLSKNSKLKKTKRYQSPSKKKISKTKIQSENKEKFRWSQKYAKQINL